MCGIAGFVGAIVASDGRGEALVGMADTLIHRGPDSAGYHDDGIAAIAMRRLRIIDLVTGDPPIFNEDRTVCVVFNGEIYNFRELRAGLESKGHRFATHSDTEVLVHLYEEKGEALVHDLRGMYAVALWDSRNRRLLLVRDRIGVKPLYYAPHGDGLLFASEPKAIRAFPGYRTEIDPRGLNAYLRLTYIPDPLSAFKGMSKLPPAHSLVFDEKGLRTHEYWKLDPARCGTTTEAEAVRAVRELLTDSVREELVSDVPLGAFLSGGIDSTAVVGAMRRAGADPIETFSIGLDDPGADELPYARAAAKLHRTNSHERVVHADVVELLPKLMTYLDEPLGDASAIPTYLVSGMAREQVTVALSGDGGDELFGGYNRYAAVLRFGWVDRLPRLLREGVFSTLGKLWPSGLRGARLIPYLARDGMGRNFDHLIKFGRSGRDTGLISPDLVEAAGGETAEDLLDAHAHFGPDILTRMMYLDLKTYLPGDVLTKVDRMSMAHSLEVRVPILDHRLVELAFTSVPTHVDEGKSKPTLRSAAWNDLPETIRGRGKSGFGIPLDTWFRGSLAKLIKSLPEDSAAIRLGWLRESRVRDLVTEHARGIGDHSLRLWLILLLDEFMKTIDPVKVGSMPTGGSI